MTITIGKQTYQTRKPKDLNAALVAATGCDSSEIAPQLASQQPVPNLLAKAVYPFLGEDAPALAELAVQIADALAEPGNSVAADIAKLYNVAPEPTKEG